MQNEITLANSQSVLDEISDAFYDIPFENSAFQTEAFVIAASITPERAYRAIGLRMHSKINALNEAKFGLMKQEVDIAELKEKIRDENTSKFDKRRAEIDIMQKTVALKYTQKLINDAISELNVLYKHFKKLPKFTREEFEAGERLHFEQRLTRQVIGCTGAKESLINMGDDMKALDAFEELVGDKTLSLDEAKQKALINLLIKKEDKKV